MHKLTLVSVYFLQRLERLYRDLILCAGSITCLEFHKSHLLSGGEDGLLCVWSTKKWECVKSIRAHK